MKHVLGGRMVFFALALGVSAAALLAEDGGDRNTRAKDSEGAGITVNGHDPNPVEAAPIQGGANSLAPIVNHRGPVMTTPTAYLIWYGNWNQPNGTDTPAGQQLVRDFLFGLSNSP